MELSNLIKEFLSADPVDTVERLNQLTISQCLDLETTRAWLYEEISERFSRLEENK